MVYYNKKWNKVTERATRTETNQLDTVIIIFLYDDWKYFS